MKKYIFFLILLFPISTFAGGDYQKELACKLGDGIYTKNLQTNYPGKTTYVRNFVKIKNTLFYNVVIPNNDTGIYKNELYAYDCTKKNSRLLSDYQIGSIQYIEMLEGEIDYINDTHIFIRYIYTSGIDGESVGGSIGVYNRKTGKMRELEFANEDEIIKQYEADFGTSFFPPFRFTDITKGKDGKLLVWITWGSNGSDGDVLRALSLDTKTFTVKNVTYDYTFKKSTGEDAWLKIQNGILYEKNNANQWSKINGVDIASFRAIGGNYGRDKNGYTLYNATKTLPKDAISTGYHLWYSTSQGKIYSYHAGNWGSIRVSNPPKISWHEYFGFDDPNSGCTNTTGSYGYNAEDDVNCYGYIGGSQSDFGIVGKVK